ncbi:MarR family winged helix-turn-helix transcriptional regulator [Dethiobacter alkaliphilus]|uniref:MarR family winged helix-turn-helix transcriptional regulator n=1 Tax=Dethiobacter alkaliphilus TaxID=427926 RepID=UPI002226A947|nr:MarR family transcriptional regulator [Dethiobacter alkaliphilus]MCW3489054.1 MarR family transcriptional regulator [Dethiobacter alkaliphilus]
MFNIDSSINFLLAKCHQKAFALFKENLEPYHLTPPQFATLAFLWKKDCINQIQLGELMGVDRTTISGIVDRLERGGLVERGADPMDRRSCMLSLTEKGRSLQDELAPIAADINQSLAKNLSQDEVELLVEMLKKIRFS